MQVECSFFLIRDPQHHSMKNFHGFCCLYISTKSWRKEIMRFLENFQELMKKICLLCENWLKSFTSTLIFQLIRVTHLSEVRKSENLTLLRHISFFNPWKFSRNLIISFHEFLAEMYKQKNPWKFFTERCCGKKNHSFLT